MIERDTRWKVFYDDISLDEFVHNKLPNIEFNDLVNSDVKESFRVIHKLLVHSYFEYLFIDVAVAKALQTFEMALKIRFKEVTQNDWDKNLKNLIEWFRTRDFFERNDSGYFDHIRNTRNYLSHPKAHHFAGSTWFHWISAIVDLINDLYEDIDLRQTRKALTSKIEKDFNLFLKDGANLNYGNKELLVYSHGPLLLNNKITPSQIYLSLLTVFDIGSTEVKWPFIFGIQSNELNFSDQELKFTDHENNVILLSRKLGDEQKLILNQFTKDLKLNGNLTAQHNSLLFDSSNLMLKIWREIRFK